MGKVSICIPAYNNAKAVSRLLRSIKEQDFEDYEVVITDDSTGDEVSLLVEDTENIRYYRNETRLGATANWNKAMSKCKGGYIKMMHHDDWFTDAHSLSELVRLLEEHPEADIAFCGTRQAEDNKCFDRHIWHSDLLLIEEDYRNLFLGNTIGAPSATIYRSSAGVYDENLTWLVDMEFYMGILKNNPCFCYTEKPLISIGVSKEQLTEECRDDHEINIREYGYIYNKYGLSGQKRYKDKLLQVLMDNEASYNEAKVYGITKSEYSKAKIRKLKSKAEWKLGIRR